MKELCIALVVAFFALCASFFPEHAPEIIHWINGQGIIAPLLFLLLYCFATLFFLPTMVMTLVGGAIFGPFFGTVFNVVGATTGATIAFAIGRYWVRDKFLPSKNSAIDKLHLGIEKRGWLYVALLRVVPIIPFNLVNYGLGITKIKFSHYVITTFIFLIPVEIISTYFGYAGMDMLVNSSLIYKRIFLALVLLTSGIYLASRFIKRKTTS